MIEVGKPINKEQKSLLHRLLNTQDLIDISTEVSVSYGTVRGLYYRTIPVTEESKQAVYKMINKAFEKSEEAITYFTKAKSELESMLPKV